MILGIDSTTEYLHLALVAGPETWTRREHVGIGKSHSGALLPTLEALLGETGRDRGDLDGVVACVGPGGFTSLRIGVATAEGLALAGLPTWGFSAFRLRARALALAEPCWILLDGQRGEAFHQCWGKAPLAPADKCPLGALPDLVGALPWWAPEGFRPRVEAVLGRPPRFCADEGTATLQGLVALCRELPSNAPESPLVPFYLRETDAEVNFPQASVHLSEALRRGVAR
jgi:tRNA threonylcarbamoyladenosine biosynthesis protein TsaB